MTDYTPEQIKDMAVFLSAHPEMVPPELKAQPVETAPGEQNEFTGKDIASISMSAEEKLAKLEQERMDERKATTYGTIIAVQSAIRQREAEIAEKMRQDAEMQKVVNELYSVMAKDTAEKLLKDNLPISSLKSVIETLKSSGAARVGVAAGIEMRSTVQMKDRMQALGIPSIEFTSGGN